MRRPLAFTVLLAGAGFLLLAAMGSAGERFVSGAWADDYGSQTKSHRHARGGRAVRLYSGRGKASQAEIAEYFARYGGFIDPSLNKQTQSGPFDSGFFFSSSIKPHGGDSPYMN